MLFGPPSHLLLRVSSGVVWQYRDLQMSRNTLYQLSHFICFFIVLKRLKLNNNYLQH